MADHVIENEAQRVLDVAGEQIGAVGGALYNAVDAGLQGIIGQDNQNNGIQKDVSKDIEEEKEQMEKEAAEMDESPPEPLGDDEIEIAQQNINEMYPLKQTPLTRLLPWVCCCMKVRKKPAQYNQLGDMKRASVADDEGDEGVTAEDFEDDNQRLDKFIHESKGKPYKGTDFIEDSVEKFQAKEQSLSKANEKHQDPMNAYGFGVVAYFNLLQSLICVFIVLTIKAAVIMYLYSQFDTNMDLSTSGFMGKMIFPTSLAHMPHAETFCRQEFYKSKRNIEIECSSGVIKTETNNLTYGFILADAEINGDASNRAYNDYCGKSDQIPTKSDCSNTIKHEQLKTFYQEKCYGANSCSIDMADFITETPKCNVEGSYYYMKAECEMEAADMVKNQQVGLIVVFIGMLMSLCYMMMLSFLENTSRIDFKLWDLMTCTAADYTVELRIPPAIWTQYLNDNSGQPFDQYIRETFEQHVSGLENRLDSEAGKPVKIAAITFGYKNGDLIRLLQQRGTAIANYKLNKMVEIEQKIEDLIKAKKNDIQTPVTCFVTFETQEGYDRCEYWLFDQNRQGQKNKHKVKTQLLGHPTRVAAANEPTDIIWENLQFTKMFMRKCQAKVFVAILILMICVFLLFTFLKSTAGKNKTKYPSSVNCNLMNSQFTKEEMRAYAVLDKDATLKQHGAGFYQCYCKANSSPKDIGSDRDENFCDDYQIDIQTGLLLTTVVTVLVSIFNIIIRTVNMNLIDRIGYDTHSERYSAIMTSIFIASYINTGIILSLTNANLSYTFLGFIPIQNQFADFTPSWFTQIGGSLTQTLLIQAFMPYVEICIALTIKTLLKWKDGGFPCCPRGAGEPKTKKVTNQQYINLYAGPEYMMHFRYSSIMLLVFVAFTYGLFLPVMFPIAGIGIFNMYVVERMTLAYYYRQPPMFDEKLNARAIDLLQQAPIMMFLIAYWAFGNQQIFFNQPPAVYDHGNGAQDTRHPAFYFAKPNQTMIILLVLLYLLMDNFGYKLRHQMFRMVRLIQDGSSKLKADVDENLANYWQAISGIEQKLWYSNEVYDRYNTGVQAMSDEALEKLRTSQRSKHKKHIKGNANYKVLFNMQYQQKFQYQPLDERNEAEDNELSDIITKLLNMNDHMSKPVVIGDDGTQKAEGHIEDVHFASKGAILRQLKHAAAQQPKAALMNKNKKNTMK